jgi:hypothetical protein
MMTWSQIRSRIDAAEPVGPEIDEAVAAYRRLRDPVLDDDDRKLWMRIFENSAVIAESHAYFFGPQLIRSAVESLSRERADSARQFGANLSTEYLEHAGFTREEIEDGEREFVKSIIDREMEKYFKDLRVQAYKALGLPVPEDEQ